MKNVVLALTLLLCSGTTVAAVPFKDADLHPLLRVNGSFLFIPSAGPVARLGHIDEVKVITRGGALVSVVTDQVGFGAPLENHFLRGVGSPAALAQLKTRLAQNQVGVQASCLLDPNPEFSGTYEITWYGRGGRRSGFTVYYGTAGGGFPACPPEVEQIVSGISTFESSVFIDPDSEKLSSD